ncbi:unnamed protein product [Malus baccata var. baccata]
MANPQTTSTAAEVKNVYSVWALPPDDVAPRLKKLMQGLRAEFGGPQFEPHITVVGAISLTLDDALAKFRSASEGLKAYDAKVDRVATGTGTFFCQCVSLLINPTPQVVEASAHCSGHFGFKRSTRLMIPGWYYICPAAYMPHLTILYGDLTDEEKKKAQEKANTLDESIAGLSFPVTRLALFKTDPKDITLKSWEKIAECTLESN